MKRSWLRRFTPLRRGRWKRDKPEPEVEHPIPKLRWRGMSQSERTWRRNWHSPHRVRWIKGQPCEVTKSWWPGGSDNAHTVPRDLLGDWRYVVPLRPDVHRDFDDLTLSDSQFDTKWNRTRASIRAASAKYVRMYAEQHPEKYKEGLAA